MAEAAQHHFVPKLILRNFLAGGRKRAKEQVHVFDKRTGRGFTTSIDNIMGERRFHDFMGADEAWKSFEPAAGRLENEVLPTYRKTVETRRLPREPEERLRLALLVAFQFVRTRAQRDFFTDFDGLLNKRLNKLGESVEHLDGYEATADQSAPLHHIAFMQRNLSNFMGIIARKDLLLMQAPPGRSFYLSDHPVSLQNSTPKKGLLEGRLGLSVPGIEIYLPLAADLMLAAWCPSLLREMRERDAETMRLMSRLTLSPATIMGRAQEAEVMLEEMRQLRARVTPLFHAVETGESLLSTGDNMDFINSLQVSDARRHVVCPQGDFAIARNYMAEHPGDTGWRLSVGPSLF